MLVESVRSYKKMFSEDYIVVITMKMDRKEFLEYNRMKAKGVVLKDES